MSQSNRKKVLKLLESVLALPEVERSRYMDLKCAGQPKLRQQLETRLKIKDAGSFDQPLVKNTDQQSPIGQHIGPYRVAQELGQGGMGMVYRADRDDGLIEMSVAIKLAHNSLDFGIFRTRFLEERRLLADLKHPHIAMLLDAGEFQQRPYFMMEFIEGATIDEWCIQTKPNLPDLLQVLRKIVAAIQFAHGKGVIHCDIKPGNLMVTLENEPKLLDFGIARMTDIHNPAKKRSGSGMTPAYASPEQKQGETAEAASDIYSLGLVMLQLILGELPQEQGKTPLEAVKDLSNSDQPTKTRLDGSVLPSRLHDKKTFIPDSLSHVLRKALAKEVEFRYQNATILLADLDQVIAGLPRMTTPSNRKHHDAIIWNHPDDMQTASQIAAGLASAGLVVWHGPANNQGPEHLSAAAVSALADTHTCLICKGARNQNPWDHDIAFRDSLSFMAGKIRLLPVLLPDADYPLKQSKLPKFLRGLTWVTFPSGLTEGAMTRLVSSVRADDHHDIVIEPGACPFRGLEVFREQDRNLFYGRESLSQRIVAHLRGESFISILGPSGTGKSSVVQAGVIPIMRAAGYSIVLFSPSRRPLRALATALHAVYDQHSAPSVQELKARLETSPDALQHIGEELTHQNSSKGILLIIDQFEELFTLVDDSQSRNRFIETLTNAVDQKFSTFSMLLTMRTDFLGKCVAWPDLNKMVVDHALQVEPMNRKSLTRVIQVPAKMAGLDLEDGLLERIMAETDDDAQLPLVEYALLELFERRSQNRLTLAAYEEIDGIRGALAKRAETEYQALDHSERNVLRKMFTLCLIQPGEHAEDTRRIATHEELFTAGNDREIVTRLLQKWTQVRLLISINDPNIDETVVSVAHEALIRKWQRIGVWMIEDRETARLLFRLRRLAEAWMESGRALDYLPHGGLLDQMTDLARRPNSSLGKLETLFLEQAQAHQQQELRKKRSIRNLLFALGIGGLVLALITTILFFKAATSEEEAREAQIVALSEKATAERRTREGNYHLALAMNEMAGKAFENQEPMESWLLTLAALSRDIPKDKRLPQPLGRFMDTRMAGVNDHLWTSPIEAGVVKVATSGRGDLLAFTDRDFLIRLMNVKSGRQTNILSQFRHNPIHLIFSPNGEWLAGVYKQGKIAIWQLPKSEFQLIDHSFAKPLAPTFSADSRLLALGDASKLTVIDLKQAQVRELKNLPEFTHITFVGNHLIAAQPDGTLLRIEWESDHPIRPFRNTTGISLTAQTTGKNGQLVTADENGLLSLIDSSAALVAQQTTQTKITALAGDTNTDTLVFSTTQNKIMTWNPFTEELNELDYQGPIKDLALADGVISGRNEAGRPVRLEIKTGLSIQALIGHSLPVSAVAVSPEEKLIASGSGDGKIILWDPSGALQPRILEGTSPHVSDLAFSPDGRTLAAASKDANIYLWDLAQQTVTTKLQGHTNPIRALAFSPNGRTLASCATDNSIRLWNLETGNADKILSGLPHTVFDVAFSPNGKTLATARMDGAITLRDPVNGKINHILEGHQGPVFSLAFSPSGDRLASASVDRTIRVLDLGTKNTIKVLNGHSQMVTDIDFSPDGRKLVSSSFDNTAKLWDLTGNKPVKTFTGHVESVLGVAFINEGNAFLSISTDQTIKMWHTNNNPMPHLLGEHEESVRGAVFSPNGQFLASFSTDNHIQLWTPQTNTLASRLISHKGELYGITWSKDSQRLASASSDQTVIIWDIKQQQPERTLKGHKSSVLSVAFSPDGKSVASGGADMTVRLWGLNAQDTKILRGHTQPITAVAFTPDGNQLATASMDHSIRLWPLPDPQSPVVLKEHIAGIFSLAFSPDGSRLASASADHTTRIWDPHSGQIQQVLRGHTGSVHGVAFSPNGLLLASSSADRSVRIWDAATGEEMAVLEGHQGNVNWQISFAPNGEFLATPSDDKTIRMWHMNQLPQAPSDLPQRIWYQQLLDDSLHHMGFRLDGYRLYHQPQMRMEPAPNSTTRATHPLDLPRPHDMAYQEWLSNRIRPR